MYFYVLLTFGYSNRITIKNIFRKETKPMKKSIKILSLVLALALICGALVIGVFAKTAAEYEGVEGVTVMEAADFENADTTTDVKGTDGTENKTTTIGSMGADIINRHGRLQVVSSEYEENIYVTYTPGYVQKSTGGPFISNGYASATTANIFEKSGMLNNRYQVMDFDIYFPAGRSIYYVNPAWQIRYLNAAGNSGSNASGTSERGNIGFIIYSEDTADSGIYIQDNNVANWGQNTVKVPLSATEWNHVTYIVEMTDAWALKDGTPCAEGDEGAIAVLEFTGYIIVNDVIASKYTYGNSISFLGYNDASKFKSGDVRDMVFTEWRTGFQDNSTKTYNKDAVIAFDNMSWRSINTGKYAKTAELQTALGTGVGGSLATWTDSIYDEATMPFGTLAATIGEGDSIKRFDSIEEAIAAAEAGATITLQANSTADIVIDKAITILKNGYTGNFTNDEVKKTETDEAYIFEATSIKMTVRVQACKCGSNCITAKTITVYEGANIWDAIVAAYDGVAPSCSYVVGETKYNFDGFTVTGTAASLFEGGKFDEKAVVDSTFAGKTAVLNVAYKVVAPTAKVVKEDGTLINYFYEGEPFQNIVNSANNANGRSVILLADHTTDQTNTKYVSRTITLDLNGYTIKHLSSPDATSKNNDNAKALIQVQVNTAGNGIFTLTSSVKGGKIFEAACYKNSNRASTPFLTGNSHGVVINIIGQVNGETTLSFYGANMVQAYGSRASVNVDGGYYCRNRGDNFALFDMRVLGDCSFKNATMDGQAGSIFAFSGRNSGMGTNTAKVTVDNCNLINGVVLNYISDKVTVNFTNSVIGGNIAPAVESSATAVTGDEVYIGKGCQLKKGITIDAKCTKVGDTADVLDTLTYTVEKNDWTVGADNFTLTEKTITVEIDKIVAEKINVIFTKDGKEYAVKGVAGMNATIPMGTVEGTQGMVQASAIVAIPADAVEGNTYEMPENAELTYYAGEYVPINFSITITGHLSFNFFIPVVEGIEYVSLQHNLPSYNPLRGTAAISSTDYLDAAGNPWKMIQTWPGMHLVDETGSLVLKYNYKGSELVYSVDSFGGIDYINYIIKNDKSDELKGVVANLVNASYYFNTLKGSSVSDKMTALMASEEYKAAMAKSTYTAPAEATNKAAYAKMAEDGYIKEIALIAKTGNTGLTIGIAMNGTYGFQMTNKYVGETRIDGTGYFFMHNIRSYAFNDGFTINVYESYEANRDSTKETNVKTFAGDPIATYEWTLEGYINDNAEALAGTTALEYAKAIYSYAVAGDEYIQWKKDNGLNNNT